MIDAFNLTGTLITSVSSAEAYSFLKPLTIFVVAISLYSVFIFKFYRSIARREIFTLNLEKSGKWAKLKMGVSVLLYFTKHLVVYPLLIIFYFLVLVVFFAFLAKTQTIDTILLVSMSLVAAIRITAYYHEDLSRDLAKMVPFALLGIFLMDISYFSVSASMGMLAQIPSYWKTIFYYLLFIVGLELVLRIVYMIAHRGENGMSEDEKEFINKRAERMYGKK